MSSSAVCPKCGGVVKLPAEHLPTDVVHCPVCNAEILAGGSDLDLGLFSDEADDADIIPLSPAKGPKPAAPKADADDFEIEELQEIPFDPDLAEKADDFDLEPISKTSNVDSVADDPLEAVLEEALFEDDKNFVKHDVAEKFVETASHSDDDAIEAEEVSMDEDDFTQEELIAASDPMEAAFEPVTPVAESAARPAKKPEDEPWNLEPENTTPKHVVPPPPEQEMKEKPRKKPRNSVVELAKIIVGGIVGLMVAYAILIWGLKKDPLGLAALLPPSILPAELGPPVAIAPQRSFPPVDPDPTASDEPTPEPTADGVPPVNANDAGMPAPGTLTDTLPGAFGTPAPTEPPLPTPTEPALPSLTPPATTPPATMPPANIPPADTTATLPDPTGGTGRIPALPSLPPLPAPGTDPFGAASPTTPPPTTPPADNPAATIPSPIDPFGAAAPTTNTFPPIPEPTPPAPAKEPQGVKSEKRTTLAEAQQALTAADAAVDALVNAPVDSPKPQMNALRKNYVIALANMAEALSLIAPQDDDNARALRAAATERVAERIGSRSSELSQLAGHWLNLQQRPTNGIVLSGTVLDVQPQGKLFKTLVKLADLTSPNGQVQTGLTVPVMTAENPRLNSNDSVLVIGEIVKDPSANLHQYEGNDPTAIWGASTRRLP